MSFAAETREALCRRPVGPAEGEAELRGLWLACGATLPGGGWAWRTAHAAVARRLFHLLREVLGVRPQVLVRREKRLGRRRTYLLRHLAPAPVLPQETPDQQAALLRGMFLGAGSLTGPEGPYHLELVLRSAVAAEVAQQGLRALGLHPGRVQRKGKFVLYLKGADAIALFLARIGAEAAAASLGRARRWHAVRARANRLVNCDTANLSRAVQAGLQQAEAIRRIQRTGGLGRLSPGLRAVAEARLAHPEATLAELAQLLGLGRSGVHHRLRALMALAASLTGNEEGGPASPGPREGL